METNISGEMEHNSANRQIDLVIVYDRNTHLNQKWFLEFLEKELQNNLIKIVNAENPVIILIHRSKILELVRLFHLYEYDLSQIWAADGGTFFEISYFFNLFQYLEKSSIIVQFHIEKGLDIDSITPYYPNAKFLENNLKHRMGIDCLRIENEKMKKETEYCIPSEFNIPSVSYLQNKEGIYDPIHLKNSYFDLSVNNEYIIGTELRDGWNYQQIQPKLEQSTSSAQISDVISQMTSSQYIHSMIAFCSNVESRCDISIPLKGQFIRTLLAEIERILSHLIWFSNLAFLLKNKRQSNQFYKEYIKLIISFEAFFNSKSFNKVISIGATKDISPVNARNFYHFIRDNGTKMFQKIYNFIYNSNIVSQLEGIGVVSKSEAKKFGLKGPSLRGSGIPIDIRLKNPYLSYNVGEVSQVWNMIMFEKGDVFARTQVRLWEIQESLELCKHLLHGLSSYTREIPFDKDFTFPKFQADQQVISSVEAPHGELGVFTRSDYKINSSQLHSIRILSPDMANYAALGLGILINEEKRNFPLILHSFDLDFKMIDL